MFKKLFVHVLLSISILEGVNCYAQFDPTHEKGDPPTEMELKARDGKHKGLQIDRSALIKSIMSHDSTLNFIEDKKTANLPVFTADGIRNSNVSIIGSEYDLRKITYKVFVITGNLESIHSAFDKIANVIGTIVPRRELSQWLLKSYKNVNLYPSVIIKESYSMTGNLLKFDYEPSSKSITLSIATEYD